MKLDQLAYNFLLSPKRFRRNERWIVRLSSLYGVKFVSTGPSLRSAERNASEVFRVCLEINWSNHDELILKN